MEDNVMLSICKAESYIYYWVVWFEELRLVSFISFNILVAKDIVIEEEVVVLDC